MYFALALYLWYNNIVNIKLGLKMNLGSIL